MIDVVAVIGADALWFLYAWLIGAIVSSWLSDRKGYGERPGLVTGLLTSVLSILIWLLFPPKADSKWKLHGPFPWSKGSGQTVAEARAAGVGEHEPPSSG
jgi:Na+/proline symporter